MKFILLYCLLFTFHLSLISQEPYYRTLSTEDGLPSNTVHCVFTDSKDYIWFGTPNGAVRWDSKNFKTYTIEDGLPNNEVLGFFEDSRGRLWMSTFSNELCYLKDKVIYTKRNDKRLDQLNISLSSFIYEFENKLIFNTNVKTIFLSLDSLKLLTAIDPYYKFSTFTKLYGKLVAYNNSNFSKIIFIIFDFKNNCFYPNKLNLKPFENINLDTKKSFFQFKTLRLNKNLNTSIINFYFDTILNSNFKSIKSHLIKNQSNSTFTESNHILFKYSFNLNFYQPKNCIYLIPDLNNYFIKDKIEKIKNNIKIYNIEKINSRESVISSTSEILLINRISNNIKIILQQNKINNNFKHIHYDCLNNQYFISSGSKLIILRNKVSKTIYPKKTYCSYLDKSNRLWLSDVNKLRYCDKFRDSVINEKEFILNSKQNIFIKEISEDKLKNIFFTTNNGIYIYDRKSNLKYNISKPNLLSSNECNKLVIDTSDNSFWVTTPFGLNHIKYYYKNNKLKFQLINRFLKDDGLPSNEINDIMIQGDSVYVATPKGLCMIADKNYRPDTISIPIYNNTLKVNDSLIHYDSSIYLMPNQNNLELDYSAIYYLRRDRLAIRYKLIRNVDTSIYDLTDTKLRLNALNSGEYQLIISAYDLDYPYINGESKTYKFTIGKPFYQTWWFYFLGLVTIGVVSYIYYKRKLNRIQQINHYEKKFSQLKLEALKAEMNPHFIFNCLSAIKDYILKADIEKSQYYLSKLAKLIRLALYNSKDEFVKLSDEINFIDIYIELERMRFDDKFDFIKDFNTDNFNHIQIPTMILQPFFENAIRHGKIGQLEVQGKLYFNVFKEDNHLVFDIRDNGIGIEAAQKQKESNSDDHRSLAIDIINERIEIYNHSYNLDIKYKMNSLENNEYKTQVLVYLNLSNL